MNEVSGAGGGREEGRLAGPRGEKPNALGELLLLLLRPPLVACWGQPRAPWRPRCAPDARTHPGTARHATHWDDGYGRGGQGVERGRPARRPQNERGSDSNQRAKRGFRVFVGECMGQGATRQAPTKAPKGLGVGVCLGATFEAPLEKCVCVRGTCGFLSPQRAFGKWGVNSEAEGGGRTRRRPASTPALHPPPLSPFDPPLPKEGTGPAIPQGGPQRLALFSQSASCILHGARVRADVRPRLNFF